MGIGESLIRKEGFKVFRTKYYLSFLQVFQETTYQPVRLSV